MSSQSETVAPWIRLAVGAMLGLLAVGGAVMFGGMNPALLLGWAFGVTIAAVLILFCRRGVTAPGPTIEDYAAFRGTMRSRKGSN